MKKGIEEKDEPLDEMEKFMAMLEGGFGTSKNKNHAESTVECNFKEFARKRDYKRVMNRRPANKPEGPPGQI